MKKKSFSFFNFFLSLFHFIFQLPQSENEWQATAQSFHDIKKFPNCLGAIEGRYVNLRQPPDLGEKYYLKHTKTYGIVVMALVNSNYEFCFVETQAAQGARFSKTKLSWLLQENKLNLPAPCQLSANFHKALPHVFVASETFPLSDTIITPFCDENLTADQEYFNCRLSHASSCADHAFSIISKRFRILLTTIHLSPEKTTTIVLAICHLHNFLLAKSSASYLHNVSAKEQAEGQGNVLAKLLAINSSNNNNTMLAANEMRNSFCEYFNTVGKMS